MYGEKEKAITYGRAQSREKERLHKSTMSNNSRTSKNSGKSGGGGYNRSSSVGARMKQLAWRM